jgi:hypothetical protein
MVHSTNAVCIKVSNLRKLGYKDLETWMKDPSNIYVGRHGRIFITDSDKTTRIFHYPSSIWGNPYKITAEVNHKDSMILYVKYLIETKLLLKIHSLEGKNLGCFCEIKVDKDGCASCHAQVLVDLIVRCKSLVQRIIDKQTNSYKQVESNKLTKPGTVTITFGEQAEGHHGMVITGQGKHEKGISVEELKKAEKKFNAIGIKTEFVNLGDFLPKVLDPKAEKPGEAAVLIARGAADILLGKDKTSRDIFMEQINLEWDKKAFMRGEVKNKIARYNLVYADNGQEPDYENKKGRVIPYTDIPLTANIRNKLEFFFGPMAKDLAAEGNYYYNTATCGIGYHGDAERKVVIAMRLGESLPLRYRWYYRSEMVGESPTFTINGGDIYAMSENATGYNWGRKIIYTLRHAAGCNKYLDAKPKVKKSKQ